MLNDIIFLWCFAIFIEICSPPSVGSTFSKYEFCQHRVQDDVSMPKLASKPPLLGGHFRPVLCKKYNISPTERKMARFGSPFQNHFCPRMHFQADFHIFGLDFATVLGKLCWPSLLSPLALWFQSPYFRFWFCHSSWEKLFNLIWHLACTLKQIFIVLVLVLPLFLGRSVDRHLYPRLHSGSNFHICALGFVTSLGNPPLMSCAFRVHFWFSFHSSALDFVIPLGNSV